jgi:flagellar biosynthesis protein FlhG
MKNVGSPVKICISSGKGGVGKTNITVNLAYALAGKGKRVLVIDGDLGLANVDVVLGLSVHTTLRDIMEGNGNLMDAVIYVEPNLGILPASSGVPDMVSLGAEDQAQMAEMLDSIAISGHFDYLLMDTAAGIGSSVLWFNKFADHNVVVITPDPTSMTDAYALIKVLSRDYDRTEFFLLMNLVSNSQEGQQVFDTMARVAKQFLSISLQSLGMMPQDKSVVKAVREQTPFIKTEPYGRAAQAIEAMASRVLALPTAASQHRSASS